MILLISTPVSGRLSFLCFRCANIGIGKGTASLFFLALSLFNSFFVLWPRRRGSRKRRRAFPRSLEPPRRFFGDILSPAACVFRLFAIKGREPRRIDGTYILIFIPTCESNVCSPFSGVKGSFFPADDQNYYNGAWARKVFPDHKNSPIGVESICHLTTFGRLAFPLNFP